MKKFLKYITIIGCVMILAGVGIATAAFSLGANPLHGLKVWEERFEELFERERYITPTWDETMAFAEAETETIIEGTTEVAIADRETEYTEVHEETFDRVFDEVTHLEIQIEGGQVSVDSDESIGTLNVISFNGKGEHITFNNFDEYKKLEVLAKDGEEYLIRVPAGWVLSEVEVDCAGGAFEGDEMRAMEAEFSVSGGKMQIHQEGGKETGIDCMGGDVEWTGSGELSRKIEVECAGGEVSLALDSGIEPDQVGYEMDYAAGIIDFFGMEYTGIGEQERQAVNGMPHLELDASGGKIKVR